MSPNAEAKFLQIFRMVRVRRFVFRALVLHAVFSDLQFKCPRMRLKTGVTDTSRRAQEGTHQEGLGALLVLIKSEIIYEITVPEIRRSQPESRTQTRFLSHIASGSKPGYLSTELGHLSIEPGHFSIEDFVCGYEDE